MIVYNTQIHALGDPRYRLRRPLLITIREYPVLGNDDPEVIAVMPEFDLYATGRSAPAALSHLKIEIATSYERLVELGPDKLDLLPLEHLEAMQAIIDDVSGRG